MASSLKPLSQFFAGGGSNDALSLQLLHKHQFLLGAEIKTHPSSQPPSDREAAHLQNLINKVRAVDAFGFQHQIEADVCAVIEINDQYD